MSGFQKLRDALRLYKEIPRLIQFKQKLLEARLCNPETSVDKGFSAFASVESEIEYLERFKRSFEKGITTLNNDQKDLCVMLMQNKNIFLIASVLRIDVRTVYNRAVFIWEKLSKFLKFKNIYSDKEEIENETEKEF